MSKARTKIDSSKLKQLVSSPGIDPTQWITFAVVTALSYDAKHGMFADVVVTPTGEHINCCVGVAYAGNLFGQWAPLKVDDVVVVGIPNGDPSNGGVVLARLFRASDLPPSDFEGAADPDGGLPDPTNDVVVRVEPGQQLVIRTSGTAGNVDIKVEGDGAVTLDAAGDGAVTIKQTGTGNVFIVTENAATKVYVSDAPNTSGTEQAGKGLTIQSYLESNKTWQDTHTHSAGLLTSPSGAVTGTSGTPVVGSPTVPDVKATKLNLK